MLFFSFQKCVSVNSGSFVDSNFLPRQEQMERQCLVIDFFAFYMKQQKMVISVSVNS